MLAQQSGDVLAAGGDLPAPLDEDRPAPQFDQPQRREKPGGTCADDHHRRFAADVAVAHREGGRPGFGGVGENLQLKVYPDSPGSGVNGPAGYARGGDLAGRNAQLSGGDGEVKPFLGRFPGGDRQRDAVAHGRFSRKKDFRKG